MVWCFGYRGQLIITTGQLPYPVLKNGTVKVPFLFSICLLRAINLLNNAGNRLSLGIPKAVSVFPAEQGGKTLKSQNSFFWGLCAKWCFSIIIWSPGSQFIIINTIFDREHDAATFSLYRQSKYQLIERFNTIIVTRNCHFFFFQNKSVPHGRGPFFCVHYLDWPLKLLVCARNRLSLGGRPLKNLDTEVKNRLFFPTYCHY